MAVHLTLGLTMITPIIPMIVLGLAFSLVPAAMWPSIPFLVPQRQLGTAFGVMGMLQNVGLWGVPIVIGKLTEWTNPGVTAERVGLGTAAWDYTAALLFLAALGAVAFLLSLRLRLASDDAAARRLELPRISG
jgi:MFS family permease